MKGNKKILVVAVLLLLIAVSYGTYAIYRTSAESSTEVRAAVWDVTFKDGENEISTSRDLVLTCPGNTHTATGVIAPGASCTGTVTIDATDTEVDVTYTVEAGTPTVGGSAIPEAANDFTLSLSNDGTGTIAYSANPQTATVTVTLEWDGQEGATSFDPADTGLQGQTITVPLTLTAKQVVGA